MRKIIAAISTLCAIGFAVALAGTDPNMGTSTVTQGQAEDTAQIAGPDRYTDTTNDLGTANTTTTTTSQVSSTKTCTDENGVTYFRGHAGYDQCMNLMKKKTPGQMGGTVDPGTSSH